MSKTFRYQQQVTLINEMIDEYDRLKGRIEPLESALRKIKDRLEIKGHAKPKAEKVIYQKLSSSTLDRPVTIKEVMRLTGLPYSLVGRRLNRLAGQGLLLKAKSTKNTDPAVYFPTQAARP